MLLTQRIVGRKTFVSLVIAALALNAIESTAHAADTTLAGDTARANEQATREGADTERNTGALGPVRIGAFGGIGLPRPLSIEGMLKIDDIVGLGIEYSVLPKVSISDVDTTLNAVAADVRVFPMRSGFFIGVAVGRQQFRATSSYALPANLGTLAEEVSAETWFINPRIGFLWTWSWGLTVGMDAGAQIPVSASFTNTIPSELAISQTATDVAHVFGKNVLPTVNVLRIGLLL